MAGEELQTRGPMYGRKNNGKKQRFILLIFTQSPLATACPAKLKKLIRAAGIGQIDMDGKFAAIKCILENWETSVFCVPIMQRL